MFYNSRVAPVCLPSGTQKDFTDQLTLGEDCQNYSWILSWELETFLTVAGWGRLSERSPTAQTLRSVIVPVWAQQTCLMAGYGSSRITGNMMCGGYPEGERDSCQGKSSLNLMNVYNWCLLIWNYSIEEISFFVNLFCESSEKVKFQTFFSFQVTQVVQWCVFHYFSADSFASVQLFFAFNRSLKVPPVPWMLSESSRGEEVGISIQLVSVITHSHLCQQVVRENPSRAFTHVSWIISIGLTRKWTANVCASHAMANEPTSSKNWWTKTKFKIQNILNFTSRTTHRAFMVRRKILVIKI